VRFCWIGELVLADTFHYMARSENIEFLMCLMLDQCLCGFLLAFIHNDTDIYVLDLLLRTNNVNVAEGFHLQRCLLHLPS
jgi:hypothetical protein